jgi:hypothetical protein
MTRALDARDAHLKDVATLDLLEVVLSEGDTCGYKVEDDVSGAHCWRCLQRPVCTEQDDMFEPSLVEVPAPSGK